MDDETKRIVKKYNRRVRYLMGKTRAFLLRGDYDAAFRIIKDVDDLCAMRDRIANGEFAATNAV